MSTKWSDMPELPNFFDRYIKKVDDLPLMAALLQYTPAAILSEMDQLLALGDQVYAPGKWTIKTMIQHMIDTERIMTYRALCISRNESGMLPGFNEDDYAENSDANERTLHDLLEEWTVVRNASLHLFDSFSEEMLQRKGNANGLEISVLAIGFVLCGHPIHHAQIIKERYYPLLG
ncbi:DinB family protein [Jiulongibacter sp. NS-SX5]|uniref:DinB family protein n=1 Tax=Jiulongibacter sp. NS-SX5 TaxID=3463854 RepID=UPI0040592963